METFKKVIAVALVLVMALGVMMTAYAVESPTAGPTNPGYDEKTNTETNEQDHFDNVVVTKFESSSKVVVLKATSTGEKGDKVEFRVARNANDEETAITQVGDGKNGVFNSKAGQKITLVNISSTASSVKIAAYAFKGAKVATLKLSGKKVSINKNAFKGTKKTKVTIRIQGSKKKASDFTFSKGAFNGLSKKSKVIVSKSTMTKSEFKKLKKKLRAAGFKGSITRK